MRRPCNNLMTSLLVVLVTMVASRVGANEPIVFGHMWEEETAQHRELVRAAQEVERRLDGRYHLDIFPKGQLGATDAQLVEGFRNGTTGMSFFNVGHAATIYPPIAIGGAPFTFRDFAHWDAFRRSELFAELKAGFENAAEVKVFGLTYYGERHITSKRPIRGLEDLKGLVIRVPNKATLLTMFRALGAKPVAVPFGETYQALKEGLVDAEENPLPTILAMRFHEVSPFVTLSRHITDGEMIVMSSRRWTALPATDRAVLTEIFAAMADRVTAEVRREELALAATFQDEGVVINEIDRTALATALEPLFKSGAFPWSSELHDRVRSLR
jgi:tripartite ATP-independent transporter DctP family solute receptor